MTENSIVQKIVLAACLVTVLVTQTKAQSTRSLSAEELRKTIVALDAALFGSVMGTYGHCDLEKNATYFAEDVEFFHDQGGLTVSRKAVVESVKNVCGTHRRELVPGSLEVYPIPGYGAIQAGAHKFYRMENGKEVGGTVAAKFVHVWQNKGGEWKLTRVVSYAH
jgi:hypothetical protein